MDSERRSAERLDASEWQFRQMADAVPQILWITDPEGRLEFFNRQWFDYVGNSTLPRNGRELAARYIHADDQPDTTAAFEAAVRTGETYIVEHRILSAQGDYRWFLVRGEPFRDPQTNAILRWFGTSVDIHDRKVAEQALRDSEARLRFLDRLGAETAPLADADAVLATTTRLLGEHLNLSVCAYADMDEDEDGFTIRGDWAAPGSTSIVGHYSLADFGKLAVEQSRRRPAAGGQRQSARAGARGGRDFQGIGIAATICMPLVKEGRLTALMAIHDRVPRAWTDAELALLREVTARSWAHVERVAAVAELRDSEARYRTLFEVDRIGLLRRRGRSRRAGRAGRLSRRRGQSGLLPPHRLIPRTSPSRWLREAAPELEEVVRNLRPRRADRNGRALRAGVGPTSGRWFDVFAFRTGARRGAAGRHLVQRHVTARRSARGAIARAQRNARAAGRRARPPSATASGR